MLPGEPRFPEGRTAAGWNDALVLDKESNEDIALTHSFTHKVGVKGWQRIGPGIRWPVSAQISEETRHGPEFD
jgi:hypothetical protein